MYIYNYDNINKVFKVLILWWKVFGRYIWKCYVYSRNIYLYIYLFAIIYDKVINNNLKFKLYYIKKKSCMEVGVEIQFQGKYRCFKLSNY